MTTVTVLINAVIPLFVLLAAWLAPYLAGPTVRFGVRVPARYAGAPVIAEQRTRYRWWVAGVGGAAVAAGMVFTAVLRRPFPGTLSSLAVVGVCLAGLVRANRAIRAVKQREDWYAGVHQAVVADTTLRTLPERFPWAWTLPALLVLAVTLVAGIVRYPSMPQRLPMHYDAQGSVDRFAAKSIGSAFVPVIAQAAVTALLVVVPRLVFRARPDLDPASPVASAGRHRRFTVRTAIAVLVLAACGNLSLLAAAWDVWNGAHTLAVLPVMAPVAVGLVVVLTVALRTGQGGGRLPADDGAGPGDSRTAVVHRDDDAQWRAGVFYVNRADPALFVSKRFGVGWTVNMGNPRALLLLVPLVALPVILAVINR